MTKAIIIEDEKLAAQKLLKMISEIDPEINIIGIIGSIEEAVNFLSNNTPDLIFLDIHLSDGPCFNIFDQVEVDAPIIFTTAYDQYAIKAFKQNSIDYLLKPISEEELINSIEKYKKVSKGNKADIDFSRIAALLNAKKDIQKRFMVYAGSKILPVNTEDVAYFFAESKAVFLATFSNRTFPINYSLENVLNVLDEDVFYRINRKIIVNIKAIKEVSQYSKSKLKVTLEPSPSFEAFVPLEKITAFKRWLNK